MNHPNVSIDLEKNPHWNTLIRILYAIPSSGEPVQFRWHCGMLQVKPHIFEGCTVDEWGNVYDPKEGD